MKMLKIEWKKFFSKRSTIVLLTIMLLGAVILAFMEVSRVQYIDADGKEPAGIARVTAGYRLAKDKNKWKGELTSEKIADIVENYYKLRQQYQGDIPRTEWGKTVQSYEEILWFASKMYIIDDTALYLDMDWLTEKDLTHIYDAYAGNLQNMVEEYGKTPEQVKFLKEQYRKIEIPIHYKACDSWENRSEFIMIYFLVLVVVIAFLAAGIFDEEFRNHAEMIFFTTKYGRSKAVRNKIVVGILMTTIVYWVGTGIFSLISFGIMGVSGFNTPYQFENPYSFYVMTQGQRYLLVVVCGYIACLLSSSVTMLVTAKMHTVKVAVCLPFFMYYVLIFISKPLSNVTNVFYFTTDILVNINKALLHPHILQIGNLVFRQIPFVMVLYFLISVILFPFIYRSYSGYDSANKLRRESRKKARVRKKAI
ncbi:MAG: ABC transporter permease [Clostridium sp.]|nr:ABC transporter permease [Clostridium sp.]